jgi:hypothetical protein
LICSNEVVNVETPASFGAIFISKLTRRIMNIWTKRITHKLGAGPNTSSNPNFHFLPYKNSMPTFSSLSHPSRYPNSTEPGSTSAGRLYSLFAAQTRPSLRSQSPTWSLKLRRCKCYVSMRSHCSRHDGCWFFSPRLLVLAEVSWPFSLLLETRQTLF